MANRIKIRHGNGKPTTDNLLPYELGWNGSILYINNNGTITALGGTGAYLPITGGRMTGRLELADGSSVYSQYSPMLYLRAGTDDDYQKMGSIFANGATVNNKRVIDRLYLRQYSYNSTTGETLEKWDQYRLPVVTADKTGSNTYEILTNKTAVAVNQGGTGATSAAGARTNLGLGSIATMASTDYLPVSGGTMNNEKAITFQITRKKDDGPSWAFNPLKVIDNASNDFFHIGVYGTANVLNYAYFGSNIYNSTNNFRIYSDGNIMAQGCSVIRDSGTTNRRIFITDTASTPSGAVEGDLVLVKVT